MKVTKKLLYKTAFSVLITTIWGCGVSTQKQMVDAGQSPLDKESLYTLVANHSLQLTAIDFDAIVYFQENGKMSAISRTEVKDSGNWDITSDNLLCLDFAKWYFSDLKCYSVFAEQSGESYVFFTQNGARYYTGTPLATNPKSLLTTGSKGKKSSYLEQRRTQSDQTSSVTDSTGQATSMLSSLPDPEPSKAEMKHLVVTTARNCPSCDLSGADLSQADLIGANLAGANLAGANLHGANLRRANLSGANLHNANLSVANLPGANLTKSNLKNANFTGANLVKANLTGSATDGIILQDALLEGTTGIK